MENNLVITYNGKEYEDVYLRLTQYYKSTRVKWASLVAQTVKNLPPVQETWVWSPGQEDPLEKGMATHSSSILAWRIPWTKDPGRLQYIQLQRVGHDERLTILTDLLGVRESPSALIPSQKQGRATILQGRRTGGQGGDSGPDTSEEQQWLWVF